MDEMKLSLSTKFMRGVFAKLISRLLRKKYGYKIDIYFDEVGLKMQDGRMHLHLNVDVDMDSDEFKKLLESVKEG